MSEANALPRLYNRVGSGGFAVEAAFALAEAPLELVELDSRPGTPLSADFAAINPWRQVPTLVLPDGTTITETAAILIHLATLHPQTDLAPPIGTSSHALFLRYMVFVSVNVYEPMLRRIYPERFTTDPAGTASVSSAAGVRLDAAFELLESELGDGPMFFGESVSALDVYIGMLFTWARRTQALPRLARLRRGVRENPLVAPVWRRHFNAG